MKKIKSVLSVILAFAMLACVLVPAVSARTSDQADTRLQFNEDGKFRILQIADIQDNPVLDAATRRLLIAGIESQKPDLIVLSGDNIAGYFCWTKLMAKAAIASYMDIFAGYGIPVAMVYGNHDDEATLANKAYQMSVYESYPNFVGCRGEDSLSWYGTYSVPIYSSTDANDIVFNVWMFDSGNYNDENDLGGYGCVHKDQIEWYQRRSSELKARNGGEPVPSILFQHIVVPEIWDALAEVPAGTANAIEHDGRYLALPDGSTGELCEAPCPPKYSNGQFAALRDGGDVIGMYFGHDHVNSWELEYQGVKLATSPGCGFTSYGNGNRGFRVIDIDENDPWNYEDFLVDYATLCPSELDACIFDIQANEVGFLAKIKAIFSLIPLLVRDLLAK
ncbi:MAG: metallophosphoesterase [Clostridia bacterium]|nr:metallophosphoesterase [Clostridia bacterium]